MINTILKSVFMICIILAIVLLFNGHFSLQARHEQLRTDFDGHWHYNPTAIPDFSFGKAKIFEDEGIPYTLTKPKKKSEDSGSCYFWSYYYYGNR